MGSRAGETGNLVSMATNASGATEGTERLMHGAKASANLEMSHNSGADAKLTSSVGGSSQGGKRRKSKLSKAYLLLALLGAVLIAVCSVLRSIASGSPFASMTYASFVYLVIALLAVAVLKAKHGSKFYMPWWRKVTEGGAGGEVTLKFDIVNCTGLICGGLGEFGVALCSFLAFKRADEAGINSGLAGVLMPLNALLVFLISRCVYNE